MQLLTLGSRRGDIEPMNELQVAFAALVFAAVAAIAALVTLYHSMVRHPSIRVFPLPGAQDCECGGVDRAGSPLNLNGWFIRSQFQVSNSGPTDGALLTFEPGPEICDYAPRTPTALRLRPRSRLRWNKRPEEGAPRSAGTEFDVPLPLLVPGNSAAHVFLDVDICFTEPIDPAGIAEDLSTVDSASLEYVYGVTSSFKGDRVDTHRGSVQLGLQGVRNEYGRLHPRGDAGEQVENEEPDSRLTFPAAP